jgi:hypothetical protein
MTLNQAISASIQWTVFKQDSWCVISKLGMHFEYQEHPRIKILHGMSHSDNAMVISCIGSKRMKNQDIPLQPEVPRFYI